jgi:hypothetical protein
MSGSVQPLRPRHRGMARIAVQLAATALLLGGASQGTAQDDGAVRAQVQQRITLASRLISDSGAAQRIAGSGNQQAVAHLDEGRVHLALAQDLLTRGDLGGARRAVDDALRHLGQARRLAPDTGARKAAAQQRYEAVLSSVERLMDAWRARAGAPDAGSAEGIAAVVGMPEVARARQREGLFDEANQALALAERQMLGAMNRSLHATTLDYTVRAGSPAEELQQEGDRYRGFAELLPLAIRDLKPRADALWLAERYAETSRNLHAQAQQAAQGNDLPQALAQLRSATLYMQRALQATGLAAPVPSEAAP